MTKVVLRLDFESIPTLRAVNQPDARPEFSGRISHIYPLVIGQATTLLSLNIGPAGSGISQQVNSVQWHHRKVENGTCVVVLAPEFMAIEYGQDDFDHFPPFRTEVTTILEAIDNLHHVPAFNRIGLRYINEVNLPDGNPLDWDGLIAPDLVTAVKACRQEDMNVVRSMHQLHARQDDCTMLFNYGLNNPDFPNMLARRVFILDYDCSQVDVPGHQSLQVIDTLNSFCETMFEHSIENNLRDKMEIINNEA